MKVAVIGAGFVGAGLVSSLQCHDTTEILIVEEAPHKCSYAELCMDMISDLVKEYIPISEIMESYDDPNSDPVVSQVFSPYVDKEREYGICETWRELFMMLQIWET